MLVLTFPLLRMEECRREAAAEEHRQTVERLEKEMGESREKNRDETWCCRACGI